MNANSSVEEKRIPRKPRAFKTSPIEGESGKGEAENKTIRKRVGMLKQTGAPFEARAQFRSRTTAKELERASAGEQKPYDARASDEPPASPAAPAENEPCPNAPASQTVFNLGTWIRKTLSSRATVGRLLLVFLPVAAGIAWAFFSWGAVSQRRHMLAEIAKQGVDIPQNFQARLDKALLELRTGRAEKSLVELTLLEKETPAVSSLTYLVALAAMQAGHAETASAKANQSLAKHERVSDSLALKAVLETQSAGRSAKFGDPRVRAEAYLRQALVADAANPSPYVELATLLRYQKRDEEAMQMLQAARSRLNPVDSRAVVDVSIALLHLQNLPDNELPDNINPDKDVASLFSAAYVAMRKGNFVRAATLLATARERLSADLYFYLIDDPAIRKFARQPELAKFFR
jgi:tetratricopeptide (TPR) repeat protein